MVYLYQLVQFHCSAYLDQNCLLFVHLHIVISERAVPRSSPPWASSSFLFPSQLLLGFLLSILWIYLLDSANGSKFCVSFFFHMDSDKIWQCIVCVMLHLFPFNSLFGASFKFSCLGAPNLVLGPATLLVLSGLLLIPCKISGTPTLGLVSFWFSLHAWQCFL